jgi:hypothetical protein
MVNDIASIAATPASLLFAVLLLVFGLRSIDLLSIFLIDVRVNFRVFEELDEDGGLPFIDVVVINPFVKEPVEDGGPPFIDVLVIIPVVEALDEDGGPPFIDVVMISPFVKEPVEDGGPSFIDVLVIIPVVEALDEDGGLPFIDVLMNFPVVEALDEDDEGSFSGFISCPVAWIKSIARIISARQQLWSPSYDRKIHMALLYVVVKQNEIWHFWWHTKHRPVFFFASPYQACLQSNARNKITLP